MKVKLGMKVIGDVHQGKVIAMTKNWCIYQDEKGEEFAEPWDYVSLLHDGPEKEVSLLAEKELDNG